MDGMTADTHAMSPPPRTTDSDRTSVFSQMLQEALLARRGVFRLALTEFPGGGGRPLVLEQCVGFLERHGLYVEGIFRVPGDEARVAGLRAAFNGGRRVLLEEAEGDVSSTVYDVASLLKLFFRELPRPLFPQTHFRSFLAMAALPSEEDFRAAFLPLFLSEAFPGMHRQCLCLLLGLLVRVDRCSEHNQMTTANLAIVFSPTLMRPPEGEPASLVDIQPSIEFIRKIIQHAEYIFDDLWHDYAKVI